MNACTANAIAARRRKRPSIPKMARKLGNVIAPRDHAGKGDWSKDADIPPVWGWTAGIGLASFVLVGRQVLGWLLSFAS